MKQQQHRTTALSPSSDRPVLIYDGFCNFCRFWIGRWHERTGKKIRYRRSQQVAARFHQIPQREFDRAVQLVEPGGAVTSGADAIFRALKLAGAEPLTLRMARSIPGFLLLSRGVYRFIADHRTTFSFFTRLLWGRSFRKPTFFIARWVFLRLLAAVYFIAFLSLLVQLRGLIGRRGILPAEAYLDTARERLGNERYSLLPTIFWLNASDGFLIAACIAGMVLSCALLSNFWPSVCLILLWALYLSFATISRTFLGYQWDVLLLECGFLSIFMVPLSLRPDWRANPLSVRIARGLLLWLLFRLMFESGAVKLTSGDPTWRNLTAMKYHYETQPLPLWTAWYLNQSPLLAQKISALAMFAIEFLAPFTIIAPARIRRGGCAAMVALQALIAGSGNYCFFNVLTASLCVLTLDDAVWPRRWRSLARLPAKTHDIAWPVWIAAPVAALTVSATMIPFINSTTGLGELLGSSPIGKHLPMWLRQPVAVRKLQRIVTEYDRWPEPLAKTYAFLLRLRTFNGYGLFAVMTTDRPEIVIEGSNDREHWLAYEFKWKPGDVARRPRLVAPHQPRLDWQMWFAALGSVSDNWFDHFLLRLLEGSPDVLALLEKNPFPDAPPRYLRAVLYDYHFTRRGEGDDSSAWWKRERKGLFYPEASLRAAAPASPVE